jgi:hypothetical protein
MRVRAARRLEGSTPAASQRLAGSFDFVGRGIATRQQLGQLDQIVQRRG